MTKRLIDANSFVLEDLLERDKTEYLDTFVDGVRAVMKAIRTAPTVNAIEVVRCQDCKHRHDGKDCTHPLLLSYSWGAIRNVKDEDFCSYGERKEA